MAATKAVGAQALSGITGTAATSANNTATTYAQAWFIKAVVGSTMTVAATFYVSQSPDGGTTVYNGPIYSIPLAALAAGYFWTIALDPTCTSTICSFTAGTGATSCTFTAQLGTVTGV
jgi:hypothetical protein